MELPRRMSKLFVCTKILPPSPCLVAAVKLPPLSIRMELALISSFPASPIP
ncbi:hypothetical protein H6G33_12835 [Calothrix sp. FACHB-1219]|uniref:hypothetical protein n=1 Tax=unclassified Calothrix TaxID=2619626 RepID=UPI0016879FA6|nr:MULTISPECIES: hypothetical protein [unclassified Calothrix]MBD2202491.1 hypothetical protein [Calothrix sp. FACHB-168]MBD2217918.1 hypothetical protein [Calothrix sp. FACHB-1219]